jgi:ribosomal protein S18 acetylase RimI-like enzyme
VAGPVSGVWARFEDVTLVATDVLDLEGHEGFRQAFADGIERGFDGELPALPEQVESYLVRAHSSDAGFLALLRDCPVAGEASVVALAIDPEARGNAYATKALLAAERRLQRDGITRTLTRVPRTNGRGLYFMLRVGFTPLIGGPDEGATWFARGGSD